MKKRHRQDIKEQTHSSALYDTASNQGKTPQTSSPLQQASDNSIQNQKAAQFKAIADNSPQAQKAAQFKSIADNSPQVKKATQLKDKVNNQPTQAVAQRVVKLDGKTLDDKDVDKYAKDPKEKAILMNWMKSKTEHNFEAYSNASPQESLQIALQEAKSKPEETPDLYKKDNLKFATETDHRLPTLYFKNGNESGRLRQQHPEGPLEDHHTNQFHYFFENEEDAVNFDEAAFQAMEKDQVFRPAYNYKETPANGDYHVEVTYMDREGSNPVPLPTSAGDGGLVSGTHISGGLTNSDTSQYTEDGVDKMYKQVTGQSD